MAQPAVNSPTTILVVDDEEAVRRLVVYPFERDGYRVLQAATGEEALSIVAVERPDLILLDLMLPGVDGYEVCRRVRATSMVPIIMLTARDDEIDKVLGLELGADDYVTKPFSVAELRSRVRAVLRRSEAATKDDAEGERLVTDDIVLDLARRTCDVRGERMELTYVEFEILAALMRSPGRVLSRRALLEAVWESADYREQRTIDVHVRHLREKLEVDPSEPVLIQTVRGVGYRFPGIGVALPPLRRFRGLYLRLALVAIATAIVAVAAVYVLVVPPLQGDLERQRLNRLYQQSYENRLVNGFFLDADGGLDSAIPSRSVVAVGLITDARVSVWQVVGSQYSPWIDSGGATLGLPPAVARKAAFAKGSAATGFGDNGGRRSAEVAYAIHSTTSGAVYLVLFSTPVDDVKSSVSVVERRILVGAAIAVPAAALLALLGSYALTRRLRRLQRAADRLASGSFDTPVIDPGKDEITDLARSLDSMRVQLGQLETARRTFIANASHELRTPLTALGGFLELASEHDADPEARDGFLRTMREQVDRLAKLATDLLDLSRLDAGGVAVELEPFDLSGVAEDCVREVRGLASRRGSEVLVVLAAEDVHALGDEARARQILRALLDNALRHTPAGSRIVVTVEPHGDVACLQVADNGPGIAEGDQRRLFERFYRAPNAAPQGSGLGLAIADELARRMGGSVEVTSKPGDTRFSLNLPLASH